MEKNKGALYIATGEKYYLEACESAKSLKKNNDIHTTLISNMKREEDIFDKVIEAKVVYNDLRDKAYNIDLTPYEKTIYLDTDTLIVSNIEDIFDLLERVDVAASIAPKNPSIEIDCIPDSFPELNAGVIAFKRTSNAKSFLQKWRNFYENQQTEKEVKGASTIGNSIEDMEFGKIHDQPPFRRALFKSDVKFSVLPREYNLRGNGSAVYSEVKIIHDYARHDLVDLVNKDKHKVRNKIGRTMVRVDHIEDYLRLAFSYVFNKLKHFLD